MGLLACVLLCVKALQCVIPQTLYACSVTEDWKTQCSPCSLPLFVSLLPSLPVSQWFSSFSYGPVSSAAVCDC